MNTHTDKNCNPDFLIIGGQRCGTTTLFFYLHQHPDLYLPIGKEVHFFDLNYDLGIEWYQRLFTVDQGQNARYRGEATPYYLFHPVVPQRIAMHIPGIKLIALLRNPVDRAYSHFLHSKRMNLEPLESFEEAIALEFDRINDGKRKLTSGLIGESNTYRNFSYLSRGFYYEQISHWLNYFPLEQFCFIKSEEMFDDPMKAYSRVCRFLEIPIMDNVNFNPLNTFSYSPISPEQRKACAAYFERDMDNLRTLLGESFYWK